MTASPLQILALALSIATLSAKVPSGLAKSCQTEDYDDGVCIPLQKCEKWSEVSAQSGLSDSLSKEMRWEQEKCADGGGGDGLICCKQKLRPQIPSTFEGIKPMTRGKHDRLLPDHTVCGLDSADRIFNGNLTSLDQYPWLVLIKYVDEDENEFFHCGGSLINSRYVLTAAHCINKEIAGVRLGEWNLETNPDCVVHQGKEICAPPVVDVGIELIAKHKNFTRQISRGGHIDLALVRLDREVEFGKYVAPVCLPKTEVEAELDDVKDMFVAGWGMTENGTTSSKKLFVPVNNVPIDECREKVNAPLIKIEPTMICALGAEGRDACQGDSGGPLMEIQKTETGADRFFLKGVVAKGLSCGSTKPGFYMNVYKQLDWILSNMEP